MDLIFTPAYAQAAGGAGGFDPIGFFVPLIGIFAIMYFLIIRPQQKRMKEHQAMIDAVRRGDEVVTSGGLVAKITRVKDDSEEVEAEIAEGVRVRILKATIANVLTKTEPAGGAPKPAGKPTSKAGGGRGKDKAKGRDAAGSGAAASDDGPAAANDAGRPDADANDGSPSSKAD